MNNDDDKYKLKAIEKSMERLSYIVGGIAVLVMIIMLLINVTKAKDIYGKSFMIMAIFILVFIVISAIFNALKMDKLAKIFSKIPEIIFMTFWISVTSFMTYIIISTKDFSNLWLITIFWLFGIFGWWKIFKKK